MSESNDQPSNPGSGGRSHPIYYGGSARQLYYGGSARPMYYGGSAHPAYYGGGVYGGFSEGESQADESMVGAITTKRLLRVCMQRWITIMVFIFIGLLGAFTVYKLSPTIYEASSIFEMNVRRPTIMGGRGAIIEMDSYETMEQVFYTRVRRFTSQEIFEKIITAFRNRNPEFTMPREELLELLERKSKLDLQKRSKLVKIAIRTTDAKLSQDLANIYMDVVREYTTDLNAQESAEAIRWLKFEADREKAKRDSAHEDVREARMENLIDLLKSQSFISQQALAQVNLDVIALQRQVAAAILRNQALEAIKDSPERFGTLPSSVSRSDEILNAFKRLQVALSEKNALLARYTALHPEVQVKEREVEGFQQQFADWVYRALETSQADLTFEKQQLELAEAKRDDLVKTMQTLDLKIATAQMKSEELIYERDLLDNNYQGLLNRIREAQYAADENTAIIKPVEPARLPENPVLPMPFVIFSAGPFLGLMLGVLFVLLVDHLEDKITSISDIEQRLHLKTLVVLPHVRRMKREQIARIVSRDKFSQFAEAVASLRNLLDSPRYVELSKVLLCVSTQPGEGKTITSCSLAISCALSGEKTLLIDFDMRRPRIARIFEKQEQPFTSLPHTLAKADPSLFSALPLQTDVTNLDVVCSKASSEINPSSLMGSGAIVEFFKWARENYDRIIVDSPPFGVVGDVMTLSSLVDAVMIMCCPQRTRYNPLKHTARHLTEAGARVIGVIVNDVDFERHRLFDRGDYHYRYAYQYGKKYAYTSSRNPSKRSKSPALAVGSADVRELAEEEESRLASASTAETDRDVKDLFDASMVDDEE